MTTERLIVVLDQSEAAAVAAPDAERVLGAEPGVVRVYASPALETVYVAYDPARCSVARLVTALLRTGFRISRYRRG